MPRLLAGRAFLSLIALLALPPVRADEPARIPQSWSSAGTVPRRGERIQGWAFCCCR